MRYLVSIMSVAVCLAMSLAACSPSDYCAANKDSLFCSRTTAPSVPGEGCQYPGTDPGMSAYDCNIDQKYASGPGLNKSPTPPATGCGVVICGLSVNDARQRAADIAGVSVVASLQCASVGRTTADVALFSWPTWPTCISGVSCADPCSDGAGGTLQSIGQNCNAGFEMQFPYPQGTCCAGLECVGYRASTAGTCEGSLPTCAPVVQPDAGTAPCRSLGQSCGMPFGSSADCCAAQQAVAGRTVSTLGCEPTDIESEDQAGTCRVDLWQPCSSSSQCAQGAWSTDDQPLDCQGPKGQEMCCFGLGRACFAPDEEEPDPAEYAGCCYGTTCEPVAGMPPGTPYRCVKSN